MGIPPCLALALELCCNCHQQKADRAQIEEGENVVRATLLPRHSQKSEGTGLYRLGRSPFYASRVEIRGALHRAREQPFQHVSLSGLHFGDARGHQAGVAPG